MKKNALILMMSLFVLYANVTQAQKTYSQRTYTLFVDGHYERKTCYNDGSCDKLEQGFFHKPKKGDFKHIEEVWANGKWEKRVVQYY
jgi:hypothetical protein